MIPLTPRTAAGITASKNIAARRNMLRWSQQINQFVAAGGDTTKWQSLAVTVVADEAVAPDGTTTAERLTINGTSQYFYQIFAVTAQAYCLSCYVKKPTTNGHRYTVLKFSDGVVYNKFACFDLDNGVFNFITAGWTPTTTITDVGNGWWRISASWVFASTHAQANIGVGPCNATGDSAMAGGDVGKGTYLWGVQMHPGTTPDVYIETTTAPTA